MSDSKQIAAEDLIPELKEWNNGAGIKLPDWISCIGDYEHLIGYAQILWPDFVEFDGGTFLASQFREENYGDWMKHCKKDRTKVEMVMNHVHILDLFPNIKNTPTEEVILFVGCLLRETWSAKLRTEFPSKSLTVSFPEEKSDDLVDYEITFFENR